MAMQRCGLPDRSLKACLTPFFFLTLIVAVDAQSNNTSNGSNGTNESNCTDNATAVNEVNYTGLPLCPEVPPPPCYTDRCDNTIVREAINACKELTIYGANDVRCALFNQSAYQACNISCQNCGSIASAMYDECIFTVLTSGSDFNAATQICQALADDFETLRCPSALIQKETECFSRESDDCQYSCGNWHKCNCWKLRGEPGEPDRCEGETELLRLDGTPDNCDAIPRICFNHRPGTFCGKYKHCDADLCIIKGITSCPLTDPCQAVGACFRGDGKCYYTTLPDGTPCEDGLFYTHTKTCQSAVCTGIVDRCLKYDVQCNTLNTCLVPTDKVRGACDPASGSCVFEAKPDNTSCSSQYGGVLDGNCSAGLCRRTVTNPCENKQCPTQGACVLPPVCDSLTGECVYKLEAEGKACEDGDPNTVRDRCIEGQCVGDQIKVARYAYQGKFACQGNAGLPEDISRYFGDVLSEQECEDQCSNDPWCRAYAYGYYICFIYGGDRTMEPNEDYWGKKWLRLDPAAQPGIRHDIQCFTKQDSSVPAPFFDERAAWFGLTVVIVVVIPALWGLAMVWRPLSRSFRNLTGCCGGLREDEWSPSKEGWGSKGSNGSKDMSRSMSQMSFGNSTSKVHNQMYLEDDETMDDSQESSRTENGGSQELEQVKWNQANEPAEPVDPNDPRGEVQERR